MVTSDSPFLVKIVAALATMFTALTALTLWYDLQWTFDFVLNATIVVTVLNILVWMVIALFVKLFS